MSEGLIRIVLRVSIIKSARRWRCPLTGIFLALVLLLSACTRPPMEAPLRIGTNNWPGYEPLYLARSLGHYKDTPIRLVELPSASEVIHALRNRTLDEHVDSLVDGRFLPGGRS